MQQGRGHSKVRAPAVYIRPTLSGFQCRNRSPERFYLGIGIGKLAPFCLYHRSGRIVDKSFIRQLLLYRSLESKRIVKFLAQTCNLGINIDAVCQRHIKTQLCQP